VKSSDGPSLTALYTYRAGDPIPARALNQTNRAVERLVGGVAPPRQVESPSARPRTARFQLQSISADHLVCKTYDGTTVGDTNINVAKPPQLRESNTAHDGHTFDTFVGGVQRTADSTEVQVIVPNYVALDEIYAIRDLRGGTGVTDAPEWLDLNVDARAWAKQAT